MPYTFNTWNTAKLWMFGYSLCPVTNLKAGLSLNKEQMPVTWTSQIMQ